MAEIITPGAKQYPGTLVVAPYPFAGSPDNTNRRLQATADFLGADILPFHATGTGSTTFSLALRSEVQPDNFASTCRAQANYLRSYTQDYNHVIGWGDSGRGANVMGMQLEDNNLFGRLLLRDCYNLKAPQGLVRGWLNFIGYQLWGERGESVHAGDVVPESEGVSALPVMLRGVTEMLHFSNLMRGEYTLDAAEELASNPDFAGLPIRSVSLTHTFTGVKGEAEKFSQRLEKLRKSATRSLGDTAVIGAIEATLEEGRHSDLTRPKLAAKHLRQTLGLPPTVWPQQIAAD